MTGSKPRSMADDYRALLTEREEEILTDEADVSDKYYYRVVTRVRNKIDRLGRDLELLDEHHDTLGDELRETVGATADTDAGETGENGDEDTGDQSDPPTGETDDTAGHADVVDRVAEAEGWADDDRLDDRKAAARAVLEFAREHGTVSKQQAKERVYPEHPVEGQTARTWYRNTIRPVLNVAAEYDSGERRYRLVEGRR